MDKKYAFIFAFLLAGLILCDVFVFKSISSNTVSEREEAVIERVIDGDTLKLTDGRTLRLLNINSPEKGTPGSNLSFQFLRQFENTTISLEITGIDKYSRSLARIYAPDYLNLKIVELGLASKFLVQDSELSLFDKAERSAIAASKGIWEKSGNFGCFKSSIDEQNELVFLENACNNISLKGWFLKDESRKIYKFGDIHFEKITLHSSAGEDNSTDIFWNNKDNIWNNDRDSLYIFDENGRIAHSNSYGY